MPEAWNAGTVVSFVQFPGLEDITGFLTCWYVEFLSRSVNWLEPQSEFLQLLYLVPVWRFPIFRFYIKSFVIAWWDPGKLVYGSEICDFKAGICNLALDTSKFFGLQVAEHRSKLDQATCKTLQAFLSRGCHHIAEKSCSCPTVSRLPNRPMNRIL